MCFGSESLSSLEPKMWDLVPDSFENEKSLERFKNRTKSLTMINVRVESVIEISIMKTIRITSCACADISDLQNKGENISLLNI